MTSSNGNIFRVTGPLCMEFPAQSPVTRSFDGFFYQCLNKRLSKQSWRCWFETPSRSLWRHNDEIIALWHSWYAPISLLHHDACRCLGVKRVPDHKQPSCWLDCDYDATWSYHYRDVIIGAMASQITSLTIVYSTVYPGADQRKHQSSASLAFARGIHRWPGNSPHKWPVTRKMFPFDDVIMIMQHIVASFKQITDFRQRWGRERNPPVPLLLMGSSYCSENALIIMDVIMGAVVSCGVLVNITDYAFLVPGACRIAVFRVKTICLARDQWTLGRFCRRVRLLCPPDPWIYKVLPYWVNFKAPDELKKSTE